jgi:hypothetical protein
MRSRIPEIAAVPTGRWTPVVTKSGRLVTYFIYVYEPDLTLMRREVPGGNLLLPIGIEIAEEW